MEEREHVFITRRRIDDWRRRRRAVDLPWRVAEQELPRRADRWWCYGVAAGERVKVMGTPIDGQLSQARWASMGTVRKNMTLEPQHDGDSTSGWPARWSGRAWAASSARARPDFCTSPMQPNDLLPAQLCAAYKYSNSPQSLLLWPPPPSALPLITPLSPSFLLPSRISTSSAPP